MILLLALILYCLHDLSDATSHWTFIWLADPGWEGEYAFNQILQGMQLDIVSHLIWPFRKRGVSAISGYLKGNVIFGMNFFKSHTHPIEVNRMQRLALHLNESTSDRPNNTALFIFGTEMTWDYNACAPHILPYLSIFDLVFRNYPCYGCAGTISSFNPYLYHSIDDNRHTLYHADTTWYQSS